MLQIQNGKELMEKRQIQNKSTTFNLKTYQKLKSHACNILAHALANI